MRYPCKFTRGIKVCLCPSVHPFVILLFVRLDFVSKQNLIDWPLSLLFSISPFLYSSINIKTKAQRLTHFRLEALNGYIANNKDPDDMPHYAIFHLGLHC